MDKNFKPPKPREMFVPDPLSVRIRRWRPSGLQIGLMSSLVFHLAVIPAGLLAWTLLFGPIDFARVFQDTPLEVVLVNARTKEAPTKAQAIAQANLAGGGEADTGLATSPLVTSPITQNGDAEDDLERQIDQQMEEQRQLLQNVKAELASMPQAEVKKGAQTPQQVETEERRKQMLKQLAALEKTIQEQNSRPRRRYVSPATREEVYAIWGDQLRQRIEAKGTRNFPTLNGKPLHGDLYVDIVVNAKGQVLDVTVKRGSGNPMLDQRAVAIARQAGPFEPFTPAMRLKADELEWTWHFTFEREGMTATAYGKS